MTAADAVIRRGMPKRSGIAVGRTASFFEFTIARTATGSTLPTTSRCKMNPFPWADASVNGFMQLG